MKMPQVRKNRIWPRIVPFFLLLASAAAARAEFELAISPASLYYALSAEEARLAGGATIAEPAGPAAWDGGTLVLTPGANFHPAEDRFGIRPLGVGATALTVINLGGSANIQYGGVTFATAPNFLPGTNVTAGGELRCTFLSTATTAAVQALLRSVFFRRDTFGYGVFERNLLAEVPPAGVSLALRDRSGFAALQELEVQFPKAVSLRLAPSLLYALASGGRTADFTTFADFDSGAQLARIRPQILYEVDTPGAVVREGATPHSVYVELPPAFGTNDAIEITASLIAPAPALAPRGIIALGARPLDPARGCIRLNWVEYCIVRFFDLYPRRCLELTRFASEIEPPPLLGKYVSLATYRALESLMLTTAEGARLVALYRQHSPELSAIACVYPHLLPLGRSLFATWQPFAAGLLAGRGADVITPAMISNLNGLWDELIAHASPTLKADLADERDRFHNFQDFQNKTFAEWARLLGLAVPAAPWLHLSEVRRNNAGQFTAQLNFLPGQNYRLDQSLDLLSWKTAEGVKLATNNLAVNIVISNPPSATTFFRALVQP